MSKSTFIAAGLLAVLVFACSDSGDAPTDSGPGVQPAISVGDRAVVEGNTVLFSVYLDRSTGHAVTFTFSTANGSATAGEDYVSVTGTDTIAAGDTSTVILVSTIDDSEYELPENFSLILNSVTGASVAKSVGTATINDNDVSGVSYANQVKPLLRTSCANLACHGGSLPGGGMYLGPEANYATVIIATGVNTEIWLGGVDNKVIQPGSSETSTLFRKVDTVGTLPFPNQMPYQRPPLSLAQQQLIRDWIDQGAQDN